MRIATWNVNSIRTRVNRVVDFLNQNNIDVLLMQETKCRNEQFPYTDFLGSIFGFSYEVAAHGINQWNGVAIASRIGLTDVQFSFPDQPTYEQTLEPRAIFATCGGLRVGSIYIPNGRAVGHPHYHYKLQWLTALQKYAQNYLTQPSALPLLLGGDWNVIPYDTDTFDVNAHDGLYLSPAEREAWFAFSHCPLIELTYPHATGYTFWDYQKGAFQKNHGLRIDHFWGSKLLADKITMAKIYQSERAKLGASDHVPVMLEITEV